MRNADSRVTIQRSDYRPPSFTIDSVDLNFDITDRVTVTAELRIARNPANPADDLVLNGQDLKLLSVALDGRVLQDSEYSQSESALTITGVADQFTLTTRVELDPDTNTALEGLYRSGQFILTQCEAEGFRRITYYLDRPDVMATYRTRIEADAVTYPVLLGNGNLVEKGALEGGRHWVRWEDPFPKPSYLFALVAGDLGYIEDNFLTQDGREVTLRIYTEHDTLDQCGFAMESLKHSMVWDEQRFGLSCDLDNYNIVVTRDFNMGAMENKGLNIFNARYVLADPKSATDSDFMGVEAVIAHEYFHNWTGNRVTCRDWFQLSLKEGLTVFRDQEFSSDRQSRAVKRIEDVRVLRELQMPEDAGPMAHPIRPDSYMEINNFYTLTVYEKGAEVVRMYHTLLGEAGFRKGMDLYFARHDGQAVTCDDFRAAMADANDADLDQFGLWYAQSGTPSLSVEGSYDAQAQQYTLTLSQQTPPTADQAEKAALHIPVEIGLLAADGRDLPLQLRGEAAPGRSSRVLQFTEATQQFVFEAVPEAPVPSLLRGLSAPVHVKFDYSLEQLAFLMAHDSDSFNRWDAAQRLSTQVLLQCVHQVQSGDELALPAAYTQAFARLLDDEQTDPALLAEALKLPEEAYLGDQMAIVDVDAIHTARHWVKRSLARQMGKRLLSRYQDLVQDSAETFDLSPSAIARRRLKNVCLTYLGARGEASDYDLCVAQIEASNNMTDTLGALAVLVHADAPQAAAQLSHFYDVWRDNPLVLDKWFALQASRSAPDALEGVKALLEHPAFSLRNPNKVRSLIGTFAHRNRLRFHAADGSGYAFLAGQIKVLDGINPQVTSRLATAFNAWKRYDKSRQAQIRAQLEELRDHPNLSGDVFEIVSKALS